MSKEDDTNERVLKELHKTRVCLVLSKEKKEKTS